MYNILEFMKLQQQFQYLICSRRGGLTCQRGAHRTLSRLLSDRLLAQEIRMLYFILNSTHILV